MGTKTTTARSVDHHRPRVLLAEPDVEARDAMRRHLEGQFIVEVAGDGTAALAAIRANAPAIVLAEMRMPGLDGPQLLHQLRSDSQTAHIPVILLSACADVGARWQGLQAEADGYLYQPVSDRELIATVRTHLDLAKRKHEASVEEILQSAKELNDFFDNSSIGFHWVGPDGIILRANRAELEMMGYAEDEYVGHHISEFHADEHVINDMLARLSMNQTLHDYEARLRCKNGTIKHVLISSNVYREGNKFIHTRCLTMDVSERRRVSALQAELAAIVESSEDAIISKTLQGIVVSWNAGAERLFGYTAADMIGKPITVLMPADRLGEEEGILNRLARGERIDHVETIRRHKDGQDVHVSLSISPIRDENGQIVGVSKIARNITARKQTEAMLQASEERFRTMALTNARLYRDAQEASRVKDEFLATMSHELRTPLNAVFGWVRMARSGMLDEKGIARALETIERNARAQSQLIDDLLDVSRIVTGKIRLDIRPIDLTGVIQAAVDSIRPTADNKHVRLEVMLDPRAEPLSGDPDRIQQVVWNLLSNAVKYTPKEGRVQVRLERVNSHVEITVSDTGEGISEEFLPYVFDRFRQSDATSTRHHGGLGLGLAIVRHLVELHGGSVHAYSAGVNQGATFTVKLPLMLVRDLDRFPQDIGTRRHPTTGSTETVATSVSLNGTRIVVVEDEPDGRRLLVTILERYGAEVAAAGSALEGLDQIHQFKPDLLLSDIEMPGEDGYGFIKRVRAMPDHYAQTIPAIALTAHARLEDRVRALSAGYDTHVAKPFEPTELIAVISRLVARRQDR